MGKDFAKLKRPRHSMPGFVKEALTRKGLMDAYKKRPAYQQNDYLGWIHEAKLKEIKMKRLYRMLDELEKGCVYMNMDHPPSAKKKE